MGKPSKFLNSTEDIYDDSNDKKAYPELILKSNILNAQDSVLLCQRDLMLNYRISGRFLKEDVIKFEVNLVLLWSFIGDMVEEKGISKDDLKYYHLVRSLEVGKRDIMIKDLIGVKRFIFSCLHNLGITDLFVHNSNSNIDI